MEKLCCLKDIFAIHLLFSHFVCLALHERERERESKKATQIHLSMRPSLHGSPLAQFKFDKANAVIALFGARRSFRDLIAFFFFLPMLQFMGLFIKWKWSTTWNKERLLKEVYCVINVKYKKWKLLNKNVRWKIINFFPW
jgi:hypothetical protein